MTLWYWCRLLKHLGMNVEMIIDYIKRCKMMEVGGVGNTHIRGRHCGMADMKSVGLSHEVQNKWKKKSKGDTG